MALFHLLFLASICSTTYILFQLIKNLLLHPLSKIPGPRLPALTSLYEFYYDVILPGQYPFQIAKLHKRYGPVIRPVPDEVHINDPEFLDVIYALRGRNNPTKTAGLMVQQSVGGAESEGLHRVRREALNPYFSLKAVLGMEGLIRSKVDGVVRILEDARGGEVMNLSDVYFAFSNDLVRKFSFGNDNGLLDDLDEGKKQRVDLMRLLTGVKINKFFPSFGSIFGRFLPANLSKRMIPPAVMDLLRFKAQAGKDVEAVFADIKNDRKGGQSIFYDLRDSTTLPPEEKTKERLQDEASLIVMAGTESLAKSLGYGTFYLLHYPETLRKLRAEIEEARREKGELGLSELLKLPYLNAVILETNRLTFGVTNRMIRYSPTQALEYTASYGPHKGETYVFPPGTHMSCLTWCTHTNEELFRGPLTFDPERFLGQSDEVSRRKRSMMALGKGHRKCLGMNVANAGLSLALSKMVEYEMELFETDYRDVAFLHDYQIAHPRLDTRGIQVRIFGMHEES